MSDYPPIAATPTKEFRQSRFSTSTVFEFLPEKLRYTVKDSSGTATFTVDYANLPRERREFEERNPSWRNVGLIWVALGAVFTAGTLGGEFRISIWVWVGLVCLAVWKFASTHYSVLSTDEGTLHVIRDGKHDEVMAELDSRRVAALRSRYATVNLDGDPERELAKFRWLKEQGVIDDAELEQVSARIRAAHTLEFPPDGSDEPRRLN